MKYVLRTESSDTEFDELIEKIVGERSHAGGYGFGIRDLSWYGLEKSKADELADKLNDKTDTTGITATVEEDI